MRGDLVCNDGLRVALVALVVALVALVVSPLAGVVPPLNASDEGSEVAEVDLPINFSAIAVNMSNVGPRGQARLSGAVNRLSTAEERATLMEALKEGGPRSMANALNRQEIVGFLREVTSLAENFRYARRTPMPDGGQQIIMVTDRPLAWAEIRRASRTQDYNVTIVLLEVDKDGRGEGSVMMGTELSWNDEKNQIVIEHFASEPIRLTSVTLR